MVAVMDLRLGRLFYRCLLHLFDGKNWSDLPYLVSRCHESIFWHMGFFMARFQPGRHGLHMDGCTVMDWR